MKKRRAKTSSAPEPTKWPLEIWHDKVQGTPIPSLSDGDLARAVRQQLWLDEAVPEALRRCEANPNCGELYDGEMLKSLMLLGEKFWAAHDALHPSMERCAEARLRSINPMFGRVAEKEHANISAFVLALRRDAGGRWIDK